MKLVRFGEKGLEKPGVLSSGGEILDVSGFVRDYDEAFFASDGINQLANWLKQNESSAPRRTSDIRLGAPVARPSKIICIGLNYSDHAKETNAEVPAEPVLFMKASSSQNGPNDPIEIHGNLIKRIGRWNSPWSLANVPNMWRNRIRSLMSPVTC
jgi:2,4-diketo-3-deoxy-L-fuconate hydrolase